MPARSRPRPPDDAPLHRLRELSLDAARMEGALSLAAGIAHDFNNLLTVLVGNLYLIAEEVRADAGLHAKVRKAREAAKRGATLARQLMAVARGNDAVGDAAAIAPQRIVESLAPLLSAVLGSRIALHTEPAANLPVVLVSQAHLESVITNLVINARDAIGAEGTGTVRIGFAKREISAADAQPLRAGPYVEISVSDDGRGIPPEIIERVFEPFFSTKAKTKGSGLGLPMVRWFAEKAGGAVTLRSQVGLGTTVTVLLPVHHAETGETSALTMPLSSLPGGNERVLVLAEDAEFRSTTEQILDTLGYRTGVANQTARPYLERDQLTIIVVDAQSLSSTAAARVRTLIERRAESVGVVIVGDSTVAWPGTPARIPKPFTLAELALAVRAVAEGG